MKRRSSIEPNPYVRHLLDIVDSEIHCGSGALKFALLRRGFLIERNTGSCITLMAGSHEEDRLFIEGLLRDTFTNNRLPLRKMDDEFARRIAKTILLAPSARGMTGSIGGFRNLSTQAFKKTKFGAKVPATNLDCGIAPFVKRLPLMSIRTRFSCDGHGERAPKIWFDSFDDEILFELVVNFPEFSNHFRNLSFAFYTKESAVNVCARALMGLPYSFGKDKIAPSVLIETCERLYEFSVDLENEQLRNRCLEIKREW